MGVSSLNDCHKENVNKSQAEGDLNIVLNISKIRRMHVARYRDELDTGRL